MKSRLALQLLFQRFSDDEWLTAFGRKDVARAQRVYRYSFYCAFLSFAVSYFLWAFVLTGLASMIAIAIMIISASSIWRLVPLSVSFDNASPEQLKALPKDGDLGSLLLVLSKTQGFLLKGQISAAYRKAKRSDEEKIKNEWGIK